MGNDQKDRFGDKLRDLEHAREDKFFADRDRELLSRLRSKSTPACPRCGAEPVGAGEDRRCPNGHSLA